MHERIPHPGHSSKAIPVQLGRIDRPSVVVAAGLAILTLGFAASTPLRFAIWAPQLDTVLHTVGTVVSVAVATLAYARSRENGSIDGVFIASAFVVLATANFANTLSIVSGSDGPLGLTLADPGQLPLYFWALARVTSSALLAAGAVSSMHSGGIRHPRAILWLPTLGLVAACLLLWVVRDQVPTLVAESTLRQLADESFSTAPLPDINPGILLLDGSAAVLLVVAAVGYARRPGSATGIPSIFLETGLILAAFSQIHFVLYPAVYTGLVSTGDVLRIAFYAVMLAGTLAGSRADMQALRTANARLQLLNAAEADRRSIAERARLARELHDGLAQSLYGIKLAYDQLESDVVTVQPDMRTRTRKVGASIDAALDEARDAVGALRAGFDAGLSLTDELPRRLDAFMDRTGYLVDLHMDPRAGAVPGVVSAELLRIVDEALHNVQKHADATRIRVRVSSHGEDILLSIEDNGRGFDATATHRGHGIVGMRERANLLGGSLGIESEVGGGTAVRAHVPALRRAS